MARKLPGDSAKSSGGKGVVHRAPPPHRTKPKPTPKAAKQATARALVSPHTPPRAAAKSRRAIKAYPNQPLPGQRAVNQAAKKVVKQATRRGFAGKYVELDELRDAVKLLGREKADKAFRKAAFGKASKPLISAKKQAKAEAYVDKRARQYKHAQKRRAAIRKAVRRKTR